MEFPVECSNCNQSLYGPVKYCPFCGSNLFCDPPGPEKGKKSDNEYKTLQQTTALDTPFESTRNLDDALITSTDNKKVFPPVIETLYKKDEEYLRKDKNVETKFNGEFSGEVLSKYSPKGTHKLWILVILFFTFLIVAVLVNYLVYNVKKEKDRGNYEVTSASTTSSQTEKQASTSTLSFNIGQIERDLNRALRKRGLIEVYVEVNEDLTADLKGYTSNQADKNAALSIARSFTELKEVRQNIIVKSKPVLSSIPPSRIEPAKIEGDINRALRNEGLGGVTAAVSDDLEVILKGSVLNSKQKRRAFEITSRFKVVRRIKDWIFVVEQ